MRVIITKLKIEIQQIKNNLFQGCLENMFFSLGKTYFTQGIESNNTCETPI